jgi:hypothetical protein
MDHKIGDLVVDYEIKSARDNDLFNTDPRDIIIYYTFGIIVGAEPIDPEDGYYKLYKDNFSDGISYSILWADYDNPVHKYSTDHVKYFKKELAEVEKEIEQKNDKNL